MRKKKPTMKELLEMKEKQKKKYRDRDVIALILKYVFIIAIGIGILEPILKLIFNNLFEVFIFAWFYYLFEKVLH